MAVKEYMLIFDLDGTLWDSAQEVADSWNEVLEKRYPGYACLTALDVKGVMGKTMDEIAEALMPGVDPGLRAEIFGECLVYENKYIAAHGGKLFANVRQTLEGLIKKGYKLAIVSNCQEGYIPAFLSSMDMGEFFCDYEEWGRTSLCKSENIRLVMQRGGFEKAVYIGDTKGDETAAKAAGLPFIHAAYGFGQADDPDGKLGQFKELPEEIEKVLRFER